MVYNTCGGNLSKCFYIKIFGGAFGTARAQYKCEYSIAAQGGTNVVLGFLLQKE